MIRYTQRGQTYRRNHDRLAQCQRPHSSLVLFAGVSPLVFPLNRKPNFHDKRVSDSQRCFNTIISDTSVFSYPSGVEGLPNSSSGSLAYPSISQYSFSSPRHIAGISFVSRCCGCGAFPRAKTSKGRKRDIGVDSLSRGEVTFVVCSRKMRTA